MIFHTVMLTSESIVIAGLLVLIFILLGWIVILELRLQKVFRGKKAIDLEAVIGDVGKALDEIYSISTTEQNRLRLLEKKVSRSLGKFHTIRFNPFKDQGGNQSFATCLMDDEGNGVVISSLYSRDKVSVYAKPLEKYTSAYELIEEEEQAIAQAKNH